MGKKNKIDMSLMLQFALMITIILQGVSAEGVKYTQKKDALGKQYEEYFDQASNTLHQIVDDSQSLSAVEMLESLYSHHEANPETVKETDIIECQPGKADFTKILSKTVAKLKKSVEVVQQESPCFEMVRFYFVKDSYNQITLFISSSNKKSIACSDTYTITNGAGLHFTNVFLPGLQKITFKNLTPDQMEFVTLNGLQIFRMCGSLSNFLPNFIISVSLFVGGLGTNPEIPFFGSHVPMYMQKLNAEFIKHATGYQWLPRENATVLDYPAENFNSGDYLSIIRFDGVDNIIQYGTGSHSGHTVMALWDRTGDKPQLYIVESQDGWYWPYHGIQRTKWEEWIKLAHNADFNVAHIRLREEYQKKFDEAKAWEWFHKTEGMPYGYRNFVFTWIDTPEDNLPPILDLDFFYVVMKVLQKSFQFLDTDRLIQEGINKRLGVKGKKLAELQKLMIKRGLSLGEVMAIPEKDKEMYSDGYSYVCSSYVVSMYLESGMLGDLDIQATEFTPKDIYQLNIFENDGEWKNEDCKKLDEKSPYCQITGYWKMEFPGYNTLSLYDKMNERCPSKPPLYERPDGC